MAIPILDSRLVFPNPRQANSEGLVAIGGDLSVPRLLLAYRSGIFPWTADPITWWSPDPRAIFELDPAFCRPLPTGEGRVRGDCGFLSFLGFHVSQSLARTIRKGRFRTTTDQAFRQVMKGCAAPTAGRRDTSISSEFLEAYTQLHKAGHAHSVECWQGEDLVGGIYGVAIGGFFAGESMFHRVSDASKVALFHLMEHLRQRDFALFDIQVLTPITSKLGGITVPRDQYLKRLEKAAAKECSF